MRPSSPDAPDPWPEVARILDVALELPPEQRAVFVEQACADDGPLRAEVQAILAGEPSEVRFRGRPECERSRPRGRVIVDGVRIAAGWRELGDGRSHTRRSGRDGQPRPYTIWRCQIAIQR